MGKFPSLFGGDKVDKTAQQQDAVSKALIEGMHKAWIPLLTTELPNTKDESGAKLTVAEASAAFLDASLETIVSTIETVGAGAYAATAVRKTLEQIQETLHNDKATTFEKAFAVYRMSDQLSQIEDGMATKKGDAAKSITNLMVAHPHLTALLMTQLPLIAEQLEKLQATPADTNPKKLNAERIDLALQGSASRVDTSGGRLDTRHKLNGIFGEEITKEVAQSYSQTMEMISHLAHLAQNNHIVLKGNWEILQHAAQSFKNTFDYVIQQAETDKSKPKM
jgi:hypothetical protein